MLVKKSLINNWASALAGIAIEEKKAHQFIEQSNALIDIFKDNQNFISLLSIHSKNNDIRMKMIENVFTTKDFDNHIINALKLIVERELIWHVRDIFKALRTKLASDSDIVYGVAWSTLELKKDDLASMEAKLTKKMNQTVRLINKIDPELLGGVQVIVHGDNFDGSLRGKLNDLKQSIISTQSK